MAGIDFHSYSQLILRPWGWTIDDSPNEAILRGLGEAMATAIYNTSQKVYTNDKAIGLYPASGIYFNY